MSRCGPIGLLKDAALETFVAEHRPHHEGDMECRPAAEAEDDKPPLWTCQCSCGAFWIGEIRDRGEVFGRLF